MTYRDQKYLNDAKNYPCIRCGKDGETRGCHYNGIRQHQYGKGRGIKCADNMIADFCQSCDDLLSEKNYPLWEGGSKSIERSEEFLHWIAMTAIRRLERAKELVNETQGRFTA
jgi:hypothetical protein